MMRNDSAAEFPMFDEFDPHRSRRGGRRYGIRAFLAGLQRHGAGRRHAYVSEMLPYISGEPHVGHLKNYAVGTRWPTSGARQGRYVLHPMGFDAFGLPGENHAIRTGKHPQITTEESIASFRAQFRRWGLSIDWSREYQHARPGLLPLDPVDFLQLYRAGLAYRKSAAVNWCPTTQPCWPTSRWSTAAASGAARQVQMRQMEQWFFRITPYADRLLADLDALDWPGQREDHAAQLDRPLGGCATSISPPRAPRSGSSPPGRTPCSAPPTWSWRPSIRWWTR